MAELVSLPTCPLEPTLFEFSQIQQGNSKNIWIRSIASYLAVLVALVLLKKGIRYVVRKHRYAWWISSDVKEIVWISGDLDSLSQALAGKLADKANIRIVIFSSHSRGLKLPDRCIAYKVLDLTNEKNVRKILNETRKRFGNPTIWIHCATTHTRSDRYFSYPPVLTHYSQYNIGTQYLFAHCLQPWWLRANAHCITVSSSTLYQYGQDELRAAISSPSLSKFHEVASSLTRSPNFRLSKLSASYRLIDHISTRSTNGCVELLTSNIAYEIIQIIAKGTEQNVKIPFMRHFRPKGSFTVVKAEELQKLVNEKRSKPR